MNDFDTLVGFCSQYGLAFDVHYSEVEHNWTISVHKAGQECAVKGIANFKNAVAMVFGDYVEKYINK